MRRKLSSAALAVLAMAGFGAKEAAAAAPAAAGPARTGVGERSDEPIRVIVCGIRG